MKKIICATALCASLALAPAAAYAGEKHSSYNEKETLLIVGSTAAVGAVTAGAVGAIVGGLVGVVLVVHR